MEKKIIEDVNNFLENVMAVISRDNTTYVLNNTIHYSYIDNGKSCSDSIFIYDKLEGHGYSIVFNSKLNIIRASMFGMKDDIALSMQDFLNEINLDRIRVLLSLKFGISLEELFKLESED